MAKKFKLQQERGVSPAGIASLVSERWVKSVRTEYLDLLLIFSEDHLR